MDENSNLEQILGDAEANLLLDELVAHPELNGAKLNNAQRRYISNLIKSATIPFGMHSGNIEQDRINVYSPNGNHYFLTLGKKMIARQIRHQGDIGPDDLLSKARYLFGNPDFDFWMDLLRAEEKMVEIVNSSGIQHPVLARLGRVEGKDKILYSRPVLLIPGVEEKNEIYKWEERNIFDNTLIRRAYQHLAHGVRDLNHKLATPHYS